MGQFSVVSLIMAFQLCFTTLGAFAQETEGGPATIPLMEAIDPEKNDSLEKNASSDAVETSGEAKPTISLVSKKNTSLLEDFFSSPLNYFLVLVVCLYVYLMFVQPRGARQEKKLQLDRLNNLKKNDRVVTSAGIHGIVANINTDTGTVTLRVDENSNAKLTIDRDSIRSVAS